MNKMISNSGLICTECPAYIANQTDDDELREKTAAQWSKMYNATILPEAVNCVGCLEDDGVLFHHCTVCEIRKCCREKNVINCAHCDEYKCKRITEFFGWVPEAEKVLDKVRAGL
jgi:hypothetical protein